MNNLELEKSRVLYLESLKVFEENKSKYSLILQGLKDTYLKEIKDLVLKQKYIHKLPDNKFEFISSDNSIKNVLSFSCNINNLELYFNFSSRLYYEGKTYVWSIVLNEFVSSDFFYLDIDYKIDGNKTNEQHSIKITLDKDSGNSVSLDKIRQIFAYWNSDKPYPKDFNQIKHCFY